MTDAVLGSLRHCVALTYIDILLPAATVQEELDHLRMVLDVLQGAEQKLDLSKCYFFCNRVDYL